MNTSHPVIQHSAFSIQHSRSAFTLIEVLAAITIMAIVLPALMYGISLAANLATTTRQRNLATTLGESQLNELVATGDWQNGVLSGDFGDQAPGFTWKADVSQYSDPNLSSTSSTAANLDEIDLTVSWTFHNQPRSAVFSTIVYATGNGLDSGSSLP